MRGRERRSFDYYTQSSHVLSEGNIAREPGAGNWSYRIAQSPNLWSNSANGGKLIFMDKEILTQGGESIAKG